MAERKTYTYTPYTPSKEVTDVGAKQTSAENAYDTYLANGYDMTNLTKEQTNKTNAENNKQGGSTKEKEENTDENGGVDDEQ